MKIVNKKRKTIVSKNAAIYSAYLKKARGLMFSKQKDIVFVQKKEEKVPLHMWFVFYPIDIVFLDKQKKIVEIKENFLPFTFYFPKHNAQYILELAEGSVKKSKLQLMDYLVFD